MKPYYEDGSVTIYHGDCREVIPNMADKSLDLVATDPPYGLSYNNGDLAHNQERVFGGDVTRAKARPIANDATPEMADELLRQTLRAIKPKLKRGACYCCCGGGGGPQPLFARWTLLIDDEIGFKHAVVWDKGGLGMGIHFRRNYEFLLVGQNGDPAHRWNGGNNTPNVWRIAKIIPGAHQHPTEKPTSLMGKCVSLFSNPGDVVLDPFMGTGAAIRAAKDLGRRAIGIEIEERYCEIAAERCRQEVLAL